MRWVGEKGLPCLPVPPTPVSPEAGSRAAWREGGGAASGASGRDGTLPQALRRCGLQTGPGLLTAPRPRPLGRSEPRPCSWPIPASSSALSAISLGSQSPLPPAPPCPPPTRSASPCRAVSGLGGGSEGRRALRPARLWGTPEALGLQGHIPSGHPPPRRHRVHQRGGAAPGGTDAGTPELCIRPGSSCLPGELGSQHPGEQVPPCRTPDPGPPCPLPPAPCSPPARRISVPSAMPTPSRLCSNPVATNPASKWAVGAREGWEGSSGDTQAGSAPHLVEPASAST